MTPLMLEAVAWSLNLRTVGLKLKVVIVIRVLQKIPCTPFRTPILLATMPNTMKMTHQHLATLIATKVIIKVWEEVEACL